MVEVNMYRVINEYLGKVNLQANNDIYNRISNYVNSIDGVKSCTVTVNFKRYIVDIRLDEYSIDMAKKVFDRFNEGISYPYSAMHVRFNEGTCVRYRYITSNENKEAFYCDIVIS